MRSWLSVLVTDAKSKKVRRYTDCSIHYNSLSNKMDNSLLAVRDINHKYIVVEKSLNTHREQFEEMKKDLVFLLSENEDQQN